MEQRCSRSEPYPNGTLIGAATWTELRSLPFLNITRCKTWTFAERTKHKQTSSLNHWFPRDSRKLKRSATSLEPTNSLFLSWRSGAVGRERGDIREEAVMLVGELAELKGTNTLETGPTPVPDKFSFQCITAERNRKDGTWFGLVRVMRDPQMWANKMLSNALHISNTTAKGGIIAEKDAFDDQREAEDTYAQPNAITWAANGAVKDGRIMPKPGARDPSVYPKILEFAVQSIRDVTGVNLELLGLRDAEQPGVLEAQRKQAAMTVLASLFNSSRRFRKQIGPIWRQYVQNSQALTCRLLRARRTAA
jgi:hypothetical protein